MKKLECPKCGGTFSSPKYLTRCRDFSSDFYGKECLSYTCIVCGYEKFTQTNDSRTTSDLIKILEERKLT